MTDDDETFSILCEIEPATTPDLRRVRRQIVAFDGVTDLFLIPDNHIGRATVSSIAVAREVEALGGRAVACVNSRDRNLLGFRRDLLTAAAYGVREFLFVRGDDPTVGSRSDLTVRQMLSEARAYPDASFKLGVTVRVRQRRSGLEARCGFLVGTSLFRPGQARRLAPESGLPGPVFVGALVMASAKMATRIASDLPEIDVPADLIGALETDADAGVIRALDLVAEARRSGAFDGVHLVPVGRYHQWLPCARAASLARYRRTKRRHVAETARVSRQPFVIEERHIVVRASIRRTFQAALLCGFVSGSAVACGTAASNHHRVAAVERPSSDGQASGVSYELRTHCGVDEALLNGRYYEAVTPLSDGSGNPPPGWDNPFQAGEMTVTSPQTALFPDDRGHRVAVSSQGTCQQLEAALLVTVCGCRHK